MPQDNRTHENLLPESEIQRPEQCGTEALIKASDGRTLKVVQYCEN
jgi:hypothetical protein